MFIDYMYVVGLFNFDKIIYLKADEMPIIALYGSEFNVTNERIGPYIEEDISVIRTPIPMITYYHLLGCYVHADKVFIEEVKDKGYKEYREINVGDKLIVICRENIDRLNNEVKALSGKAIKEYFGLDDDEYRNTDKGQELVDFYGDYYQVLNKVFTHELGHAVFDCISNKSRIIKERQANYFTSVVYGGKIDKILNAYYNMVGSYYKEPLLLSHRYLMSDKEYDEKWSELI